MLVGTGIISQVKSCLDQVPKWGLIQLSFPYKLESAQSTHTSHSNILVGNVDSKRSFKFFTDEKYIRSHWIWHLTIQATAVISLFYQATLEDNLKIEICVHLYIGLGLSVTTLFSYFQHLRCQEISNLLNELLTFEKRWLHSNNTDKNKFLRNAEYRRFVLLGLGMYRAALPLACVMIASSVAIRPYSPWRFLPVGILNGFSKVGIGKGLISEIVRRTVSFLFTYLTLHICVNHHLTMAATTFLSAQSSLFWTILAFKRFLVSNINHKLDVPARNMVRIIALFREIQIIFGLFNNVHKCLVMPPFILLGSMTASVSIFVLVTALGSLDIQTTLIFGNLLLIGLAFILLVFHIAVKIFAESNYVLRSQIWCRGNSSFLLSTRHRKTIRTCWRSFRSFKIFIFHGNFFECSTPLVILDFSMGFAVNLILLES